MNIGEYILGPYPAIIKKNYKDGSVGYETEFADLRDLLARVYAVHACIGEIDETAIDNPRTLIEMEIIDGEEDIKRELLGNENV